MLTSVKLKSNLGGLEMPDWKKIKAEYVRGGVSYRKLAAKYEVSPTTLYKRMRKEKWADLRMQKDSKSDAKIVESIAEQECKNAVSIQDLTDLLLHKIKDGVEDGSLITDSQSIRQITASIKDLRDIKGMKSELDMQEQMARIDKLRKEAQIEEESKDIKVIIDGGLDIYAN